MGRDLVLTGDSASSGFFGPSSIQVGFNRVGRDLVFSRNTAAAGGTLEVSGNAVARNATCADNSPAATAATPNAAGGAEHLRLGTLREQGIRSLLPPAQRRRRNQLSLRPPAGSARSRVSR